MGWARTRMKLIKKIPNWFGVPVLTKKRIWFAFAVATFTDATQIALGPPGWMFVDELLDVIAMVLTSAALGFHLLLLPTFILEMLPVTDWLPTWIGCVGAVVILRKRTVAKPPVIPPTIRHANTLPPAGDTPSSPMTPPRCPPEF
jgi:hypothetical protein